jgi:hypothetical protein
MKTTLALTSLVLTLTALAPAADAGWVKGYHRDNGTYVQPHYRSNPDSNPYNNINPPSSGTIYKLPSYDD